MRFRKKFGKRRSFKKGRRTKRVGKYFAGRGGIRL